MAYQVKSLNGVYEFSWEEGGYDPVQMSHGHKVPTHGWYALKEHDRIIARGRIARPNEGKVADNGTFIKRRLEKLKRQVEE